MGWNRIGDMNGGRLHREKEKEENTLVFCTKERVEKNLFVDRKHSAKQFTFHFLFLLVCA